MIYHICIFRKINARRKFIEIMNRNVKFIIRF